MRYDTMSSPAQHPSRTPASMAFADDADSRSEKCGFICHVLIVLVSIIYTFWVLQAHWSGSDDSAPRWMRVAPAVVVCLFVAAQINYYVLNAFVVSTSQLDALETIQDEFSVRQTMRTAPGHVDLSKETVPMSNNNNNENDLDEAISQIFDVDVAEINDLVWEKIQQGS